jgi:hypothetical protein
MSVVIREANRDDSNIILKFIKELAQYEKAEHEVLATEQSIKDSIFSDTSSTKAIFCEKMVAQLVLLFTSSTTQHGLVSMVYTLRICMYHRRSEAVVQEKHC